MEEKNCVLDSTEYSKIIYDIQALPPQTQPNQLVFSLNANVKISCKSGYELEGQNELTCFNGINEGVWNVKPPVCRLGNFLLMF
jgi:hypothetical protein